jgi:hypothetical protein
MKAIYNMTDEEIHNLIRYYQSRSDDLFRSEKVKACCKVIAERHVANPSDALIEAMYRSVVAIDAAVTFESRNKAVLK